MKSNNTDKFKRAEDEIENNTEQVEEAVLYISKTWSAEHLSPFWFVKVAYDGGVWLSDLYPHAEDEVMVSEDFGYQVQQGEIDIRPTHPQDCCWPIEELMK